MRLTATLLVFGAMLSFAACREKNGPVTPEASSSTGLHSSALPSPTVIDAKPVIEDYYPAVSGTYVLKRTVVDGATAAQRSWRIQSADTHLSSG